MDFVWACMCYSRQKELRQNLIAKWSLAMGETKVLLIGYLNVIFMIYPEVRNVWCWRNTILSWKIITTQAICSVCSWTGCMNTIAEQASDSESVEA